MKLQTKKLKRLRLRCITGLKKGTSCRDSIAFITKSPLNQHNKCKIQENKIFKTSKNMSDSSTVTDAFRLHCINDDDILCAYVVKTTFKYADINSISKCIALRAQTGTYADQGAWKHSTETTATSRLAQHDLPMVLLASFLSMVTGGGERTAAATGTKF